MPDSGRLLILFGVVLVVVGVLLSFLGRFGAFGLGRLPGDFSFQQGGLSCFFPLASSIVLSLVLTILLNVILRILNR